MREVGERSETDGSSPDIGFTDMGGRVYDSLAGRFTTADPVMQAPFWSQGQNRYAYVFNDPINATDPSGFMSDSEIAGGSAPGIIGGSITGATVLGGIHGAAGSLGGSAGLTGLGVLHTLTLSPGGLPANTSFQVAAPSAAPTSSLTKANGMGDATSAARSPGPAIPVTDPAPLTVPRYRNPYGNSHRYLAQDAGGGDGEDDAALRALCSTAPNRCYRDQDGLHFKLFLFPTSEMVAALDSVWRWLRPPAPATAGRMGARVPFKGFQEWGRPLWGRNVQGAEKAIEGMTREAAKAIDPGKVRQALEFYKQAAATGRGADAALARVRLMERILELQK